MQFKQDARNVVSYASFRTKIDCLLRRYVLPHLAAHRPNVVVFNEDIGLATFGTGSRGAAARNLFAHPSGPACSSANGQCGALGALAALTNAYAKPLTAYRRRFGALSGLDQGFLAATDTAGDQPVFRHYAGSQPDFLALAPWVVHDGSRTALRRVGAELAPDSGSPLEDDYLETALVADLPFPPDRGRGDCAGG